MNNLIKPKPILFTPQGLAKVKSDLETLKDKRLSTLANLQAAREMGDLSENGAYKAARFELSSLDRQIRRLKYLFLFGQVVVPTSGQTINFGSAVTIKIDGKKQSYQLVGPQESNLRENKLSIESPLGRILLGKKAGDTAFFFSPNGKKKIEIENVN